MDDAPPGSALFRSERFARRLAPLRERFDLLGVLGQGAMGSVFRARDRATGREVALKVTLEAPDERRLLRFRREGEVTAALQHPGIVRIHSAGDAGGLPYLAYELVEGGRTLDDVLKAVDLRRRVALVRDAARALGHAHRRGVVHRDVKPENILVDPQGAVRVADFGLAAAQGFDRITRTGAALGTPQYMAPEQIAARRDDVGPAADVWALGVILYQALTGQVPFDGQTLVELGAKITSGQLAPPRRLAPATPPALEAVCLKALALRPEARYADGEELARDLDRALAGQATSAVRRGAASQLAERLAASRAARAGAGLALLGGAVAGAVTLAAALRPPPPRPADATAPTVTLGAPGDGLETWAAAVRAEGRAQDRGGGALVVSASAGAGVVTERLRAGAAFALEVPLPAGDATLVVEVADEAGNVGRAARRVRRRTAPTWWDALGQGQRPTLPLPPGLRFGDAPREYVNEKDGSVLVWLPPGAFVMGSPEGEPDERPAHEVRLTRGCYVGRLEVTWGQFRAFCRATRRTAPEPMFPCTDAHPIHCAMWDDASAYCAWAGLRLPTEAEWERAARGDDARRYPWGDAYDRVDRANTDPRADPYGRDQKLDAYGRETAPVGTFPAGASPWGCLEMCGNVYEWVEDWYDTQAYLPGGVRTDPTGPRTGTLKGVRGGAWNCEPSFCRTFTRFGYAPGDAVAIGNIGFRVARDP